MQKNKLLVLFALLACFFSLSTVFNSNSSPFNTPVYARMGSTGGGGGGGSSGGSFGGSFGGSSSHSGHGGRGLIPGPTYQVHHRFSFTKMLLNIGIGLGAGGLAFLVTYLIVPDTQHEKMLGARFIGIIVFITALYSYTLLALLICLSIYEAFFDKSGSPIMSNVTTPNLTLDDFKGIMSSKHINWGVVMHDYPEYIQTYADAEYLYGTLIRQYITGNHDLSDLRQYLVGKFLVAMQNEIKLKASQQTIDDVVVSKAKILQIAKYKNYTIAKLEAYGIDNEAQANANFDSSFKQEHWIDIVVFDQNNKIVNIVYGEHFHLNGQDFNHQKGLVDTGYTEQDLRGSEHDMFK